MKRLKIPRIPTRIPLPNLPSLHTSSHQEAKVSPETNATLPTEAKEASDMKSVEQPIEEKQGKKAKISVPKIPLPSISKPDVPKLHAPKIPLPSISIPSISKKPSLHKNKGIQEIADKPPAPSQREKPTASAEAVPVPQPGQGKTPSAPLKPHSKSKVSMPSLSLGKSGTRTTSKRILALSIEGTDIRLVSYHNNSIESWKSVAFDARFLKTGQVADPEGLGEAIKNVVTGIETSRCYVVCALPGLRSVSRIITVPNVSKKEMETVIPREVRRTMTVSEEDNYFHWQILPSETPQTRVFVLAVPKEPISLLLRAFRHAGLTPANIDLKPLALMRAVNQKDAIIANCEGNSMELVIVSDDIPVLIRSVFLGEGIVNQDFAVGRISDELGRTVVTYNEINKEHPLDQDVPIYLTGAVASGVSFALNVAALTGRTVQPLEAPIICPAELPIAEYMVNIGLILKVI